ncbi:MAG: EamA family transporter [Clostridia bacterium]|nr:EamA family transporter [Clostridia bacterium]
MIISSMLIFGTIGVFRRAVPLPSAFLAFSRGITGGLFILAFIKLRRKKAADRLPFRTKALLALSGALMGINWILLFEAYNYTTVAVATLCYYMQPTIVVLLSPVIFREKLTAKRAVCAFIAIAGMVLVSGVTGGGELPATNAKGIILGLGAAVFYSAVVIMNKRISGVDAYLKTVIQLLSAGLVMVPYLLVTGGISGEGFTTNSVLLLLVMGILHTGIAYVLYFGSIDGLKAQSVAILSYIDPVSALLFSALFLKEALRAAGILGAVMIIGSAVISEIQTDKTKS